MNLRTLTDEELLRHADNQFNPLTSTALESELLRRLEEGVDGTGHPLLALVEDMEVKDLEALLAVVPASLDNHRAAELLAVLEDQGETDAESLARALETMALLERHGVYTREALQEILDRDDEFLKTQPETKG